MTELLAAQTVAALRSVGATIACAESCTGGLVGKLLTDVPGSSAVYPGGVIVYSDAAKRALLGVPEGVLKAQGAVSETVAREMAERVRTLLGTRLGAGVTGLAGPDGDGSGKPVGLIYVSLADGETTTCRALQLSGTRGENRKKAAQTVLEMAHAWAERRKLEK